MDRLRDRRRRLGRRGRGPTYRDGVDTDGDGLDCEASCHDGYVYFAVCPYDTWLGCETFCQSGGHEGLVSIQSSDENDAVYDLVDDGGFNEAFIGLHDLDGDGSYEWTDGAPLDFTDWAPGEPGSADSTVRISSHTWEGISYSPNEDCICQAR